MLLYIINLPTSHASPRSINVKTNVNHFWACHDPLKRQPAFSVQSSRLIFIGYHRRKTTSSLCSSQQNSRSTETSPSVEIPVLLTYIFGLVSNSSRVMIPKRAGSPNRVSVLLKERMCGLF